MGADYEQYPFPEGKHPSGWLETTVGEVLFEIRSGYSSGKHNQTGQGIPHLRPMNVTPYGEIAMNDVRFVSPGAGSLRLAKEDILFTNTSSTVWVGKTALVEKPGDWGFSNHMTRLRVADGMSPEFVAQQLHYLCMSGYFAFHCKKYINQSSVSGKQLSEEVPFRLPPANEQKRIVTRLNHLLSRERRLREQLDSLPKLIEQYRASVLEAACTGRLVPTEAELTRKARRGFEPASVLLGRILVERRAEWEVGQLARMRAVGKEPKDDMWKSKYRHPRPPENSPPEQMAEGFAWVSLDQLLHGIEAGKSFKCLSRPATEEEWGVIRVSAMSWNEFNESENKALPPTKAFNPHDEIREGDILLSRSNTTDLVGASVLVGKTRPKLLLSDKSMRLLPSPLVHAPWLQLAISSKSVRAQFSQAATGASGSMLNVSQEKVLQAAFALPPVEEQRRIVAEVKLRLAAIDAASEAITTGLQELAQLRASLFHCALYGKLVPQNPADEDALVLLQRIAAARKLYLEERKKVAMKPMKKKTETSAAKRELLHLLNDHADGLTPDQLMAEAGYTSDEVPLFYKALRKVEKEIQEVRPERKVVILKRRWA